MLKKLLLPLSLAVLAGSLLVPVSAAEKAKISDIAPIEELTAAADEKIKELETALADEKSYQEAKKKSIPRDAGVVAVLAQAIAEHQGQADWKGAAPAVRNAAIALARSESYEDAKKAFETLQAARGGTAAEGVPSEHEWDKLIDVHSLMAEVNARNAKLRRAALRPPRDPAAAAQDASVLGALALVIEADRSHLENEADLPKWQGYAQDLQVEAAKVAAALRAKDQDAAKAAFIAASKSCAGCHNDFRVE